MTSDLLFIVGTYKMTVSLASVPRWKGGDTTDLSNSDLHLMSAWQSFLARVLRLASSMPHRLKLVQARRGGIRSSMASATTSLFHSRSFLTNFVHEYFSILYLCSRIVPSFREHVGSKPPKLCKSKKNRPFCKTRTSQSHRRLLRSRLAAHVLNGCNDVWIN